MAKTTTTTVEVRPGMEQQVRELRATLAEINSNIASMDGTIVTIGERDGWADPRIPKIEIDIEAAEAAKVGIRGKIAACLMVQPQVAA
ncbi:MAG: hypothetical protein ACXWP0_04385 [Ktedonobacterales bacterium]